LPEVIEQAPHEALVSIIIPAYNAADFIGRTLDSVRAQSHPNLEIIVVDDGSTDSTRELVLLVVTEDDRVRVISTTNQGVAAARNRGVAEANGTYIAFVDADDLWHPRKVEKQLALLSSLPDDWGAVYTLYHFIDLDDRIVGNGGSRAISGYIYARHLSFRFIGNGSTLLLRKQAFDRIGGYDSSYAAAGIGGCEDLDYELKLFAGYKVGAIAERLVGYRVYSGNMSSDHTRMARAMTEVIERAIRRGPPLSDYAKASARAIAVSYSMVQMARSRRIGAAAESALSLMINAPLVFVQAVASNIKREIVARRRMMQQTRGAAEPQFEGNPVAPVLPSRGSFWERRRIQRLSAEDARIEASLFSNRINGQ
jgi:glycosyltransferase involved in cell wall biosynthesis